MSLLKRQQLRDLEQVSGRLLVAYSGGCDSHALLHQVCQFLKRSVEAIHINHGLHEASDAWQVHCESVCRDLDVNLHCYTVEVSRAGSLETNARQARYEAFAACLAAGDVLLLAHHRDDQVETVLMNSFSGRAPYGILGMPEERNLGAAKIYRPLLEQSRAKILSYAESAGLDWLEDPSNTDIQHTRNYLRHEVIPTIKRQWPNLDQAIVRSWAQTAAAMRRLQEEAATDLAGLRLGAGCYQLVDAPLDSDRIDALLRQLLQTLSYPKEPGQKLLSEMQRVLFGSSTAAAMDLNEFIFQKYGGRLYTCKKVLPESGPVLPIKNQQPFSGGSLETKVAKGRGFSLRAHEITCKARSGGESILVRGHHRSIKNLLQGLNCPPHVRAGMPLIWFGETCIGICPIDEWHINVVVADGFDVQPDEDGLYLNWQPPGLKVLAT